MVATSSRKSSSGLSSWAQRYPASVSVIKGILVVCDTETGTYAPLPGADDPDYVQKKPPLEPRWPIDRVRALEGHRKDATEDATTPAEGEGRPRVRRARSRSRRISVRGGSTIPPRFGTGERAAVRAPQVRSVCPWPGLPGEIESVRTSLERSSDHVDEDPPRGTARRDEPDPDAANRKKKAPFATVGKYHSDK